MAYQTITQFNATGLDGTLQYVSSISPTFFPMVLFSIFIISTLGIYFSQLRLRNRSDFLSASTVGSFFTTIIAFILSLINNVINTYVVVASFVITVILAFLLIISER